MPHRKSRTKEELEVTKLELEINQLKKWWKRPAYIAASGTLLLALFSIYITLSTGFFSKEKALIELRKENLKKEIIALEQEKAGLNKEMKRLYEHEIILLTTALENARAMPRLRRWLSIPDSLVKIQPQIVAMFEKQLKDAKQRLEQFENTSNELFYF